MRVGGKCGMVGNSLRGCFGTVGTSGGSCGGLDVGDCVRVGADAFINPASFCVRWRTELLDALVMDPQRCCSVWSIDSDSGMDFDLEDTASGFASSKAHAIDAWNLGSV